MRPRDHRDRAYLVLLSIAAGDLRGTLTLGVFAQNMPAATARARLVARSHILSLAELELLGAREVAPAELGA